MTERKFTGLLRPVGLWPGLPHRERSEPSLSVTDALSPSFCPAGTLCATTTSTLRLWGGRFTLPSVQCAFCSARRARLKDLPRRWGTIHRVTDFAGVFCCVEEGNSGNSVVWVEAIGILIGDARLGTTVTLAVVLVTLPSTSATCSVTSYVPATV